MIPKIFLLLIISIALSGCLPSVGPGNGKPSGSDQFLKGKIVSGFPPVPLYSKAEAIESYGREGKFGASYITGANVADVVKFYSDALPKLGWEANLQKRSETNYLFEIKNDKNRGQVIVNTAADGKKTAITISVELR